MLRHGQGAFKIMKGKAPESAADLASQIAPILMPFHRDQIPGQWVTDCGAEVLQPPELKASDAFAVGGAGYFKSGLGTVPPEVREPDKLGLIGHAMHQLNTKIRHSKPLAISGSIW